MGRKPMVNDSMTKKTNGKCSIGKKNSNENSESMEP